MFNQLFKGGLICLLFLILMGATRAEAAVLVVRPGSYEDFGFNTNNPQLSYDYSLKPPSETYAQIETDTDANPSIIFSFQSLSQIDFQALTLNINGEAIGHDNDRWRLRYSIDGGRRWFDIFSFASRNLKRDTWSVDLSSTQNIGDLKLRIDTDKRRSSDNGKLNVYDIWLEAEYVATNPQVEVSQAGFRFYDNLDRRIAFGDENGVLLGDNATRQAEWAALINEDLFVIGSLDNGSLRLEKRSWLSGELATDFGDAGALLFGGGAMIFKGASFVEGELLVVAQGKNGEIAVYKVSLDSGNLKEDFPGKEKLVLDAFNNVSGVLALNEEFLLFGESLDGNWRVEKRSLADGGLVKLFGDKGVFIGDKNSRAVTVAIVNDDELFLGGSMDSRGWLLMKASAKTGEVLMDFGVNGQIVSRDGRDLNSIAVWENEVFFAGRSTAGDWYLEKRDKNSGELIIDFGDGGILTDFERATTIYDMFICEEGLFIFGERQGSRWMMVRVDFENGDLNSDFGDGGVIQLGGEARYLRAADFSGQEMVLVGADADDNWRVEKRDLETGANFTKGIAEIGKPLLEQNQRLIVDNDNFNLRLRMGFLIEKQSLGIAEGVFKLQYGKKIENDCNSASYQDVNQGTPVYFFENKDIANGDLILADDTMEFGQEILFQNYAQSNPFLNQQSGLGKKKVGLWDFSLGVRGLSDGETFCIRAVTANGLALDNYLIFPEITFFSAGFKELLLIDKEGSATSNLELNFESTNFSWNSQRSESVIGEGLGGIAVLNHGDAPSWSLSLASLGGADAKWKGKDSTYPYNQGSEGVLGVDLSQAKIIPESGCDATGVSLGQTESFKKNDIDSITILRSSVTASRNCQWLVQGIRLNQQIPPSQKPGIYELELVLTLI